MSSFPVTVDPHDHDNDSVPHAALAFHNGEDGEVEIALHILENPREDHPASLALLTGLVLLAFQNSGRVSEAITRMFPNGLPTERQATDYLRLLAKEDANDVPV